MTQVDQKAAKFESLYIPEHLFLGDNAANVMDRNLKSRQARGDRMGTAKLSSEDVIFIRGSGITASKLAHRFGVDVKTIRRAKNGEQWRHLNG